MRASLNGRVRLPWLKLLHISTVVPWCGPLLYLLLALAGAGDNERPTRRRGPAVNAFQILDIPDAGAAAHERAPGILQRQLKQLVQLIDELMDVSRITHGRLVLQRTAVSLQDIVRQAFEACEPTYQATGQQLELQLPTCPSACRAAGPHPVRSARQRQQVQPSTQHGDAARSGAG